MTRVAILMPYYNHPAGLLRSLASLCNEGEKFTLFLVDDGNQPAVEFNPPVYPFPIRMIRLEKNSGIVAALNAGLKQIALDGFDLVARLDAGDVWIRGRLAAQREFLLANPDHLWVGSWVTFVGANNHELFTMEFPEMDEDIRKYMPINSACCHPAVMFRMETVRTAGNYSAHYPAAEDYEFFWRLLDFGKAANLGISWLRYEFNPNVPSISIQKRRTQLQSRLKLQCKKFDRRNWRSWWGVVRTILLLITPSKLIQKIKLFLRRT